MTRTQEQMRQQFVAMAALALAQAIRELGEVPSGHLYARVMGNISYESYQEAIASLKHAQMISEEAHLLRWMGPTFGADGRRQ